MPGPRVPANPLLRRQWERAQQRQQAADGGGDGTLVVEDAHGTAREIDADKLLLDATFEADADPADEKRAVVKYGPAPAPVDAVGNFTLDANNGPRQTVNLTGNAVLTAIRNLRAPLQLLVVRNGHNFDVGSSFYVDQSFDFAGDSDYIALAFEAFAAGRIVVGGFHAVTARTPGSLNRAPVVSQALPSLLTLEIGQVRTFDLGDYFRDPDGDALRFEISNTSMTVAGLTRTVGNDDLTVTAGAAGSANIVVIATDPHGASARQEMSVRVSAASHLLTVDSMTRKLISINVTSPSLSRSLGVLNIPTEAGKIRSVTQVGSGLLVLADQHTGAYAGGSLWWVASIHDPGTVARIATSPNLIRWLGIASTVNPSAVAVVSSAYRASTGHVYVSLNEAYRAPATNQGRIRRFNITVPASGTPTVSSPVDVGPEYRDDEGLTARGDEYLLATAGLNVLTDRIDWNGTITPLGYLGSGEGFKPAGAVRGSAWWDDKLWVLSTRGELHWFDPDQRNNNAVGRYPGAFTVGADVGDLPNDAGTAERYFCLDGFTRSGPPAS